MRVSRFRLRRIGWLAAGLALASAAAPARALETVLLKLPLVETSFRVKLSELEQPARLLSGSSDLAELDRATNGAVGRELLEVFNRPLPLQVEAVVDQASGTPLLNQALLAVSALGQVEGLPAGSDIGGAELAEAVRQAASGGQLTLLSLLRALPGDTVTVDLGKALATARRLQNQQAPALELVRDLPAATVDPALSAPGAFTPVRSTFTLPVSYRPQPLQVVLIKPSQGGNGQLVVISHGLWDAPESFEGWARHLASHGYTVVLPLHPGSDRDQQRAMLSGEAKPPSPEELRLRPLDVKAILDGFTGADTQKVVVIGHSWGATTALQLAGLRPSSSRLEQRCNDGSDPRRNRNDPDRNMSWVLQCSFLSSADRSSAADPRVIAVAAVSPPLYLLFDQGSTAGMTARALLVTGSRDWVVPAGPEAIAPFSRSRPAGHQLVVAGGGDHFNLRAPATGNGGPLRGLLLGWVNGAYAAGPTVRPAPGAPPLLPAGGWGDADKPLVDATSRVLSPQP
ncbi:alpha/beta fold hydrolase [Synechococcus sp. CS-1328]|uniref:alpha/beta hydrolase family protein n=1 Tax=Synechococcus sp. CS-1328 TaxID=2847976 RepID=UPI00223B2938|nr:alpha/beta fold hydrolase [Synechococcus sp. CS-1328]MCT0224301.1 alpha/beta fold hydrolase [Synechococcus sp. CS-1328]